jgi:O-methyltransferase
MAHHSMPKHSSELFDSVTRKFADLSNVNIKKGSVHDILDKKSPAKIAFLHLDLNGATVDLGALDRLFDRVVSGGIIILDDYGWASYRAQKEAEDQFFAARGCQVLELPTGQGMVLKLGC